MDAIAYLTEEVSLSVKNDISPLTKGGTVGILGGFSAGPLAFFAVVNKLGYLLTGETEISGMHTFMVEYLGRHNEKYRHLSGILIGMYRHALTHEWQPREILLRNGALLRWRTIRRQPKTLHLSLQPDPERPREIVLSIVLSELYADLVAGIGHYVEDLKRRPEMSRSADERLEASLRPISQADLLQRCKTYLRESDFDYVFAQAGM